MTSYVNPACDVELEQSFLDDAITVRLNGVLLLDGEGKPRTFSTSHDAIAAARAVARKAGR